jgi:hypothetical protein
MPLRPRSGRIADDEGASLPQSPSEIVFDSLDFRSTGLARLDAQSDFRRARRAYRAARIGGWLRRSGCRRYPRALGRSATLGAGSSRLEVVPLQAIVGTLDPTASFDSEFRPAARSLRRRWERVALAYRRGDALPPVTLRRYPDGYYVVDGRHRVSVARALRHRDIDAWVTGPRHSAARQLSPLDQ